MSYNSIKNLKLSGEKEEVRSFAWLADSTLFFVLYSRIRQPPHQKPAFLPIPSWSIYPASVWPNGPEVFTALLSPTPGSSSYQVSALGLLLRSRGSTRSQAQRLLPATPLPGAPGRPWKDSEPWERETRDLEDELLVQSVDETVISSIFNITVDTGRVNLFKETMWLKTHSFEELITF